MGAVRVAIIGVGNCASSLVQGVRYYRDARDDDFVPGLMHVNLGGYHVRNVEFSAAFDIDANKVGKDLSEAIFAPPNNTYVFDRDVPKLNVPVHRGMTHDGLGRYLQEKITKAPGSTDDIVGIGDLGVDAPGNAPGNLFVAGQRRRGVFSRTIVPDGAVREPLELATAGRDVAGGVRGDGQGNIYLAGWTTGAFPGQSGSGSSSAFVAKIRGN